MGTQVEINFDEARQELILVASDAQFRKIPLLSAFLKKYGAIREGDGSVRLPTSLDQLDTRYQSLKKILGIYGAGLGESPSLSGAMADVHEREEQFSEFSSKAAAIWQGEVRKDEFDDFVSALEKHCPKRRFYDKQLLAAYHLAFSQNSCNFSVPGAGKTSVVYAAYAFLRSLPANDPKHVNHILVIGPLSSFKAWEDEFKQIFNRPLFRQRVAGVMDRYSRRAYLRGWATESGKTEVTLTSFQTVYTSEEDFRAFLKFPSRKVMIVLDEAHNIKRQDGNWATRVLRLSPFANARVVLTGTPAPNGYEDLQNLFSFIYPERNVIKFHNSALIAMSEGKMNSAIAILKKNIQPYYVRIRKKDLGLPRTTEQIIPVSMGPLHDEIYRGIERLIVPRFVESPDTPTSTLIRARLVRLRQAATNPSLLLRPLEEEMGPGFSSDGFSISEINIADHVSRFNPHQELSKLSILRELLDELMRYENKILIWSIFIGNLELLQHELSDMADYVTVISGATPIGGDDTLPEDRVAHSREGIIDRFLTRDETAILIANPQAVGESISLHHACHTAIYFDRDFNAGRFIQSKDRIHRFGLKATDSTQYYYLIADDTVDRDIHDRLEFKERRLAKLIDADDIPLFRLVLGDQEEQEDIREIIRNYERRKAQ